MVSVTGLVEMAADIEAQGSVRGAEMLRSAALELAMLRERSNFRVDVEVWAVKYTDRMLTALFVMMAVCALGALFAG